MRVRALLFFLSFALLAQRAVNPIPSGPLSVRGNTLVDSSGRQIVLQGALIPGLDKADPVGLATLSATTFSTMRQRWNMNALRLPVASAIAAKDPGYLPRVAAIVRKANVAGLVVILAEFASSGLPGSDVVDFWKTWAAHFKDNPMVIFDVYNEPDPSDIPGHLPGVHSTSDWQFWLRGGTTTRAQRVVGMQTLVDAIRSTGAAQVIAAVMGLNDSPEMQGFDQSAYIQDPNIIYEVHPYYTKDLTDAERDAHFGFLANQFPILAGEWGLTLDDSANCRAVPNNPEGAEAVLAQTLDYFESRKISWTVSTFLPGNLYIDFSDYYRADLFQSWTCGSPIPPGLGIGEPLDYYLLGIKEGDLVPVSNGSGNIMTVARGGIVAMYGDRMSDITETSYAATPPLQMGGISVRITDSSGAERVAPLLYVSPYLVNLVVPPDTAKGLAHFTMIGGPHDGVSGHVLIDDISPGLFTAYGNGRGPVIGTAIETASDASETTLLLSKCEQAVCAALPIPETAVISVFATGIRNATSREHVTATIAGIPVTVLYSGVQNELQGVDQVDLQLVPELRGAGETDLIVFVDGMPSNAVRINIQ